MILPQRVSCKIRKYEIIHEEWGVFLVLEFSVLQIFVLVTHNNIVLNLCA